MLKLQWSITLNGGWLSHSCNPLSLGSWYLFTLRIWPITPMGNCICRSNPCSTMYGLPNDMSLRLFGQVSANTCVWKSITWFIMFGLVDMVPHAWTLGVLHRLPGQLQALILQITLWINNLTSECDITLWDW